MVAQNLYVYPSSARLKLIAQEFFSPTVLSEDPIFQHFPIQEQDEATVIWEQFDNDHGMQGVRGAGGPPQVVSHLAMNTYEIEPGFYGDVYEITERELTKFRVPGSFADPISLDKLVALGFDRLLKNEVTLLRFILWQLLATGTVTIAQGSGLGSAQEIFTYSLLTYNVSSPPPGTIPSGGKWSNTSTATPHLDFRNVQILARGKGASFGAGAKAYANKTTINNMLQNTNSNDLFGRRQSGLSTINSLAAVNQLFAGDGLPQLVEYDRGYYTVPNRSAGNPPTGTTVAGQVGVFNLFIPNNTVIVIGEREDGEQIGHYQMTRNANNPNFEPGGYVHIYDSLNSENPTEIPRRLEVHRGHNGAPVLEYPGSVVIMSV